KAWYAGTPEPDRFPKGNEPGQVLIVTVERDVAPRVERIPTGAIGWHELNFSFSGDEDLSRLRKQMDELLAGRVHVDLVRLTLTGSLGMREAAELESAIETWQ